jgi:P27 family predicted phage terminase small subunit
VGKGGHNQKPTQLKIIHGTFRKHRAKKGEPKPQLVDEVPKPPRHLNGFGKWIWRRIAPELVEKRILTVLDLQSLEILCDAYGLYRAARAAMLRKGRTLQQYLQGQNSQTTPEATMMRQCWATFKAFMAEFGLSPASRGKLDIPAPKESEEDPMKRLLDEG